MSFLKISGLICLVLVAYLISKGYRRFREERFLELEAFYRVLLRVKEDIRVYHSFRRVEPLEEFAPLLPLGFEGKSDVAGDLLGVVLHMNLLTKEKKMLSASLHTLGDGNLESEMEKIENIIENVKGILQKEEKDGKKSVDTFRIVLFTVVLSLVILLL